MTPRSAFSPSGPCTRIPPVRSLGDSWMAGGPTAVNGMPAMGRSLSSVAVSCPSPCQLALPRSPPRTPTRSQIRLRFQCPLTAGLKTPNIVIRWAVDSL